MRRSLGLQAGSGNRDRVLAREATVAMTWNPKVADCIQENPDIPFLIPKEGAPYGIDSLCIPAKAPQRDLAEAFLNHLMDPKTALQTARYSGTPTPNKAAREMLSEEERRNPNIYPPATVMRRFEMTREWTELSRLRDEIWTQVKAKRIAPPAADGCALLNQAQKSFILIT